MAAEEVDGVFRQVQTRKGAKAQEILKKRQSRELRTMAARNRQVHVPRHCRTRLKKLGANDRHANFRIADNPSTDYELRRL